MKRWSQTLVASACVALAVASPAAAVPVATTLVYSGGEQRYAVPGGVTLLQIDAVGANGLSYSRGTGGGMDLSGYLASTPGQVLFAEVGQAGAAAGGTTFGGGGAAGAPPRVVPSVAGVFAGSGGGASEVRACSHLVARCAGAPSAVDPRLLVAGGGGGAGGAGNGTGRYCSTAAGGGSAYDPKAMPIHTSAGVAILGSPNQVSATGTLAARGGGAAAGGRGGTAAGCTDPATRSILSNSVSGQAGAGAGGGAGANASGFAPFGPHNYDPGAGGGGGGGYFGGGGGASGLGTCRTRGPRSTACAERGGGQGGGGGSSFAASQLAYLLANPSSTSAQITFTPVIELDSPSDGTHYAVGQVLRARWSCLASLASCFASAASGARLDTSTPGTFVFAVNAEVTDGMSIGKPESSTATYTIGGPATASAAGLAFTLNSPPGCIAAGAKLPTMVSKLGSSRAFNVGGYDYFLDRGVPHLKRVTINGKQETITVYGPNLVRRRAGSQLLSLGALASGGHALTVLVKLRPTPGQGRRAKNRKLRLKLAFNVC